MKTARCERLGTAVPIIEAAMAGAVGPKLAAGVGNAGALGMFAACRVEIENVRRRMRETRAPTSRRSGANLNPDFPRLRRLRHAIEF